jgi:RNA recognition motif-containing protein
LVQFLSEAGSVVDAFLPTDRVTGRPRGFAFVTFSGESEAEEAIRRFHDRELNGRKLTVNAADDRPAPSSRPRSDFVPTLPPPPRDGGFGGFGGDKPPKAFNRKGSRRGLRRRKRSL